MCGGRCRCSTHTPRCSLSLFTVASPYSHPVTLLRRAGQVGTARGCLPPGVALSNGTREVVGKVPGWDDCRHVLSHLTVPSGILFVRAICIDFLSFPVSLPRSLRSRLHSRPSARGGLWESIPAETPRHVLTLCTEDPFPRCSRPLPCKTCSPGGWPCCSQTLPCGDCLGRTEPPHRGPPLTGAEA